MHLYLNFLATSSSNNVPSPAGLCDGVTCSVLNEVCDTNDGTCKCADTGASCEGVIRAPSCSSITNVCQCGAEEACTAGQTCNPGAGTCA